MTLKINPSNSPWLASRENGDMKKNIVNVLLNIKLLALKYNERSIKIYQLAEDEALSFNS